MKTSLTNLCSLATRRGLYVVLVHLKTIKIDNVEINLLANDIFWTHEFNRVGKTNNEAKTIYAFRKSFKGACK